VRSYDTVYRGQHFRSRLEARWAAFFDLIGWRWEYEPFDAENYIPDFVVLGRRSFVVEVKPDVDLESLAGHALRLERALEGHWDRDVFVAGSTLEPSGEHCFDLVLPAAGILGQRIVDIDDDAGVWSWDVACWAGCLCCYPASLVHTTQSYERNPCGFYDGGGLADPPKDLGDRWREAGAAVRWER
jgi:hypothetical protein